jgi:hypothetical protein
VPVAARTPMGKSFLLLFFKKEGFALITCFHEGSPNPPAHCRL